MTTAQENAQVSLPSITSNEVFAIVDQMLTDNGETTVKLNEANLTIAGKTDTGAVFVSHIFVGHDDTGVIADARNDWNDFDYFNEVANQIRPLTVCAEHTHTEPTEAQ